MKRGKNNINKSKTIGNSILEHGDFIGHLDEDEISNKSYGSHKHRFKDDSHKGSADDFDEHEEKRDASKEELGIEDGIKFISVNLVFLMYLFSSQSLKTKMNATVNIDLRRIW